MPVVFISIGPGGLCFRILRGQAYSQEPHPPVQVPKPLTPRMAKRVFRSLPPEDARFFARYCIMFNG